MRRPTAEERAKETSLFYANLADFGTTTLFIVATVVGGSLTMLGEGVRSALLVAIQVYSLCVLYALHRGRLDRYEYGVGKLEQFIWVVAGLGLVIAAFWVAETVVETVFSSDPAVSPLGLAMAAVVNAINTLTNAVGFYAMYTATRDREAGVFGAQLRARLVMLLTSAVLQVTLTAAALAKDAEIAQMLDALGAMLIVYIKLHMGIAMIVRGLPALLDAPAPEDLVRSIRRSVAAAIGDDGIVSIRTRRAGETTFAEVAVAAAAFPTIEALRAGSAAVSEALRGRGTDIDLALVAVPHEGPGETAAATDDGSDISHPPDAGDAPDTPLADPDGTETG